MGRESEIGLDNRQEEEMKHIEIARCLRGKVTLMRG